MRSISTVTAAMMLLLLLPGCGSGGGPATAAAPLGPGPQLTVERFLQSVNRNDWDTMGELFGTPAQTLAQRDGPARGERHMQILASLLRHDDYAILERRSVAGRPEAANIIVEVVRGNERVTVPFLVVPRESGGWIIERIDNLEELA